jgi:cell division protein FtsI (penicillin-binding protein 3)
MARSARIGFLQFCLLAGALAVLVRAAQLQLVEGAAHASAAERTRTVRAPLPARRGTIYERGREALAISEESYHVSLAPEQIEDKRATARLVARSLDENAAAVERRLRTSRSVYFHGPYSALDVQPIRGQPGVHLEPLYPRIRPQGNLAQHAIGLVNPQDATGISGIESALDSLLSGVPGEAVWVKDNQSRRYESPSRLVREPVNGNDVVLTIDGRLQEIAEAALDKAIGEMDARGGSVVFLDPWTGELLAVASRAEGERSSASVFTAPFEPGSTAKLFTAAALLSHGLVDSTDTVTGENGEWVFETSRGHRRKITDTHAAKRPLTLAHAIETSSNIAMAKFSQRMAPEALYDAMRDFGFGSATGVGLPGEARGELRPPHRWNEGYDRESIAYGYSFSVTSLQLAAAYAAIANGGILYAPSLVREVIGPDGTVRYRHRPEPVRRVLTPEVSATLRRYLRGAVDSAGTGERAQLQSYALAGKTGTAKRIENGRYVDGYISSFAAIWPIDRPQLVVIVVIEDPSGAYYGGETAAPLTRTMLEEALTSRNRALDFNQLALRGAAVASTLPGSPPDSAEPTDREVPVVAVPWPSDGRLPAGPPARVPDVAGLSVRAAAFTLHRSGFRVMLDGSGTAVSSRPAAGASAPRGSTVTVVTAPAGFR